MQRLKVAAALSSTAVGIEVDVRGWIRTKRESKQGFAFIELNDGSSMANLQIVIENTVPGFAEHNKHLTTGSAIRIVGVLKESPAAGQKVEVHASAVELYGTADPT